MRIRLHSATVRMTLSMLAYVAHSIAMGNGTDKVKNTAEFVTHSVDEDGSFARTETLWTDIGGFMSNFNGLSGLAR